MSTPLKPTDRHAAFLRAINVGGRNRVPMEQLRTLLSGLGYDRVKTHLQSGNAVFAAPGRRTGETAREVEAALKGELGLDVRVLVRDLAELEAVLAANPLAQIAADPARLLVTFLSRAPDPALLDELVPADFEPDVFALGEREIYVWCAEGIGATRLSNAFWERRLGLAATGRNWNTLSRMVELAQQLDG